MDKLLILLVALFLGGIGLAAVVGMSQSYHDLLAGKDSLYSAAVLTVSIYVFYSAVTTLVKVCKDEI